LPFNLSSIEIIIKPDAVADGRRREVRVGDKNTWSVRPKRHRTNEVGMCVPVYADLQAAQSKLRCCNGSSRFRL